MSDPVLFETIPLASEGSLGLVTLNVEKTLNSLSLQMIELMTEQLSSWANDDEIKLVLFQGAGEKAFCAGGDIQNLYFDMSEHPGGPCPYCDDFFEKEYRLDYLIHTYPKPTLAWGHGIVMGGGLGVLTACQYRIGTERTRIAMPEITIGLFPDAGASWAFSQMPEHFAYFLAWTGASINGRDAKLVSLLNSLIPQAQKSAFVSALVALPSMNDTAIEDLIASFSGDETDFPESKLVTHETLIKTQIGAALSSDNPVQAFYDGLSGLGLFDESDDKTKQDNWLQKAALTFKRGTPATAQVLYRQFQLAKKMNLKQMFMQELVIAVQCSRHPDFREGVRALLIDKDNRPNWAHGPMGQVPDAWIDEHFELPWATNPLADLAD